MYQSKRHQNTTPPTPNYELRTLNYELRTLNSKLRTLNYIHRESFYNSPIRQNTNHQAKHSKVRYILKIFFHYFNKILDICTAIYKQFILPEI